VSGPGDTPDVPLTNYRFRYCRSVRPRIRSRIIRLRLGIVQDGLSSPHCFDVFTLDSDDVPVFGELLQSGGRNAKFNRNIAAVCIVFGKSRRFHRFLSDFDVRNRLVMSPIWALPFGRSGKILSDKVIGGWQISGIFTVQSGRPFTARESGNISLTLQDADRPNAVPGCNPNNGPGTVNEWMNISCFTLPATGTFGDAGRNTLTGPGMVDLDMAIARVFNIKERARLQLRGEAFNTANHPIFEQPNATQNSPSFGKITETLVDNRELQVALKLVF
jgi:hypothetical protein